MSARQRSRKHEVRVGLLLLVAVVVFGWMSIRVGALRGIGSTFAVTVVFDDAAGLVGDSAVKVAGVEVGRVKSLDVDFDRARATLVLDRSAGLRRDVRAQVRARSLLGEKYVALFPGGRDAPLLQGGDAITDTLPAVEVDDLVAALGPVLSRVDPDDVARIVDNAASLSDQLGKDGPDLLARSKQILDQFAVAAEAAPAIGRDLPPLLADLRRTTAELEDAVERADRLIERADGVIAQVETATAEVPAAVADARRILQEIEPGADDLGRALDQSDEAVSDLRNVLDNWKDVDMGALRRLLREEVVNVRLKAGKGPRPEEE